MKSFSSGQGFSTIPIAGLLAAVMFLSACGDDGREPGILAGNEAEGAATAGSAATRVLEEIDLQGPVNVLLILVDTLGARYLGSHTPDLDASPHMDRLAQSGVCFTRAFSPAPWTEPAVASILTSRMPSGHGLTNLFDVLDDACDTLPELLADGGYWTGAVVSHFLIGRKYGFAQGFKRFSMSSVAGHKGISSKKVTNNAVALLDTARRKKKPFFLLVHYFDPHFFYNHHPVFDRTAGYDGTLTPGMTIGGLRERCDELTDKDIAYLVNLYREEIAFTDHHIGRLLAALKGMKLVKNTLVILSADHGEAFMEHGWIGHTIHLYDEILHVPLIVSWPGVIESRRVETPVSLLDLAPTVADFTLSGGATSVVDHEGQSLVPLLFGQEGFDDRRPLFAEVSFEEPEKEDPDAYRKRAFLTAVRAGPYKLIHDLEGGEFSLFDLGADPLEIQDADAGLPKVVRPLKSLLEQWEKHRGAGAVSGRKTVISEEALEWARTLGYVK